MIRSHLRSFKRMGGFRKTVADLRRLSFRGGFIKLKKMRLPGVTGRIAPYSAPYAFARADIALNPEEASRRHVLVSEYQKVRGWGMAIWEFGGTKYESH